MGAVIGGIGSAIGSVGEAIGGFGGSLLGGLGNVIGGLGGGLLGGIFGGGGEGGGLLSNIFGGIGDLDRSFGINPAENKLSIRDRLASSDNKFNRGIGSVLGGDSQAGNNLAVGQAQQQGASLFPGGGLGNMVPGSQQGQGLGGGATGGGGVGDLGRNLNINPLENRQANTLQRTQQQPTSQVNPAQGGQQAFAQTFNQGAAAARPQPTLTTGQPISPTQNATGALGAVAGTTQQRGTQFAQLGDVSAKYESGGSGPGTISSGRGDPGGASYGTYQLASKTGTLDKFLDQSGYADEFEGLRKGTTSFNNRWKTLAQQPAFEQAQQSFIKKTHFDPVRKHATEKGIPETEAINESLWSMGVQHGGAKKIVNRANISPGADERSIVNSLFDAREDYVRGIKLPEKTRKSLLNRYTNEREDILDLIGKF